MASRLELLKWEGSWQQRFHAAHGYLPTLSDMFYGNVPEMKTKTQTIHKDDDELDWSRAWPGTNFDERRQQDPRWEKWEKRSIGPRADESASSSGTVGSIETIVTGTRFKAPPDLSPIAESGSEPSDSELLSQKTRIPNWFRAVWAQPHGNPPHPATLFGHPAAFEVIASLPSDDEDRKNSPDWLDFHVDEYLMVIAMDEGVAFAMAHCRSTPKFGFIPVGSANPEPGPFEFVVKLGRVDLAWMKLGLALGKGTHHPYFAKVMGLERHSIIEQFNQSQRTVGLGREQLLLGDVITNASTARSGVAGEPMVYESIKETILEACKHNLDLDLQVSRLHGQVMDGRPPWWKREASLDLIAEGAYVLCD